MKLLRSALTMFIAILWCLFSPQMYTAPVNPALALRLQNTVDSFGVANSIKGISVSVRMPGNDQWKGVYGFSHAGTPITSDMQFGIGSNTKLFTGVIVLKLIENNLLRLTDTVGKYIPSYKNINPAVTVRQLLHHTSGLPDVTSVPGYPDSMLTNPRRIFTAAELMTWAGPPAFAPGTSWEYCNTNYLLAGMIAEKVTGKSYASLLRDSILTPLGLDSTFLDVYESSTVMRAHPWQAGVDNNNIPRVSVNSAAWAAGAMYSTSDEMTQWYRALMSGNVLQPSSMRELTTFVGSGNYSVGLSKTDVNGRTVYQHGGNIWGGYNSSMMYDTASGIIVCVLTNQLPAQAFALARQLVTVSTDAVSAIGSDAEEHTVRIVPSPAIDVFTVNGPETQSISVFSSSGEHLRDAVGSRMIIADMPSGFYIVKLVTATEVLALPLSIVR